MDDDWLADEEIAEIEWPPPSGGRLATPDEVASLERSSADEEIFDGALGRLTRATAMLEDQLDDMIVELVALQRSAEVFWARFLERRGLSLKADDLSALVSRLKPGLSERGSRVSAAVKRVARRRNDLVHQVISTNLPPLDAETEFSLLRRFGGSGKSATLTARELEQLVGEVETTQLRLLSLQQALTREAEAHD